AYSVSGLGTITGGVFEFAQDTVGALKIGTGGVTVDLTAIGSGQLRLGSAAGSITANSITLASDLDLTLGNGGRALDLRAKGDISDGGKALLKVTTLSGVSNTGSGIFG